MRYIPSTDRACSIDDIAAQCRAAILKADEQQRQQEEFSRTMEEIADLLFEDRFRWQDDMLIPVPA